jgi:hypothetical protein
VTTAITGGRFDPLSEPRPRWLLRVSEGGVKSLYGQIVGKPKSWPETGLETMSLQLNDHTDRGAGGRQCGTSEGIETLQGRNNASTSRFRAVEECGSSLARRGEFVRIIRSCHQRVYRVVLL